MVINESAFPSAWLQDSLVGIAILDGHGVVLGFNRTSASALRVESSEVVGQPLWEGAWWQDLPKEQERARAAITQAVQEGRARYLALMRRVNDARDLHVDLSFRRVEEHADLAQVRLIVEAFDLSRLVRAEEQTRNERDLFFSGPVAVVRWRLDDRYTVAYATPNVFETFGFTAEEMMRPTFDYRAITHPEDLPAADREIDDSLLAGRTRFEQHYRIVRPDGEIRWIYDATIVEFDETGRPVGLLGYLLDDTERRLMEDRVWQLAHFDPLTRLPNRSLLNDRLEQALRLATRQQRHVCVMMLDLDHFKRINDTLGHGIGDELLCAIAHRLSSVLRDADTISRLGGDEFVLVLPDIGGNDAEAIAARLVRRCSDPIQVGPHELSVSPSIGYAVFPDDGTDREALMRCADLAMYRAKALGRNGHQRFQPGFETRSPRHLQLETALRRALENDELFVVYQPQVSTDGRRLLGVETLLRWQHPELGLVSPAEFIPLAEESSLIIPIGEWTLRRACADLGVWLDMGIGPISVAVNLSAVQFKQRNLPQRIDEILRITDIPPGLLELELTESVAMADPAEALLMMESLHRLGIRLSIDDFGTGYSSLSYLQRLPIDNLKIDISFVRDLTRDAGSQTIARAIIGMSRALGLSTTAEGVETVDQQLMLQAYGCSRLQGFRFGRPMESAELIRRIQAGEWETGGSSFHGV